MKKIEIEIPTGKSAKWGNATVKASDNAYTQSYSIIECKLSDNAIYRVRSTNEIFTAKGNNLTIKEQIISCSRLS